MFFTRLNKSGQTEYKYITIYLYNDNMSTILTFEELLKNDKYNWNLYFYHLLSRPNRSPLENTLMQSYYNKYNKMCIDRCCCDETPVRNCGPECCTQEPCGTCNITLRICKDVWFSSYHCILCFDCYKKEH